MIKRLTKSLSLAVGVPAILFCQDATAVVQNALKAMGAENLKTVEYSAASGANFAVGQAVRPDAPWPRFDFKAFQRELDLDSITMHQKMTVTRTDVRGGGLPERGEQTAEQYLDASSAWPLQANFWLVPYGFLRGALANHATVQTKVVRGTKYSVVTFKVQNKYPMNGYINQQTNLLDRVETWLDNHVVLGDASLEGIYKDYKDFNGLKFPAKVLHRMDGFPSLEYSVAEVKANGTVNTRPPQRAGGTGNAGGGVKVEKISDGVYYLTGTSHHSVAVEFKDHVVVVDGPLSEARSLAVMDKVKKLIPNKPIKYLVNTHQHFDHANGIRAYAAEGAVIITQEINKPYYEKKFAHPRTLAPDRLSTMKKKAVFETVKEKKVLTDGNRSLELHLLKGSNHNDGMLIAYLPNEKVLVEADVYTPEAPNGAPANPPMQTTVNLVDNLKRLNLDVDKILALHGPGVATATDLYRAAGITAGTK